MAEDGRERLLAGDRCLDGEHPDGSSSRDGSALGLTSRTVLPSGLGRGDDGRSVSAGGEKLIGAALDRLQAPTAYRSDDGGDLPVCRLPVLVELQVHPSGAARARGARDGRPAYAAEVDRNVHPIERVDRHVYPLAGQDQRDV